MHRFYLPPERCVGDALRLDGREAHHALHVLRLKPGGTLTVLDGAGRELFCDIEDASHDWVSLAVKERKFFPPLPCSVTLLVGVPKGKIIESLIQKSVELGVRRVVPLLTERVVIRLDEPGRQRKQEQWQHVAIEAIKQCGAAWLPEIEAPTTVMEFLSRQHVSLRSAEFAKAQQVGQGTDTPSAARASLELSLVGSLHPRRRHPRDIFQEFEKANGRRPKSVGVWIGPEGDFTPGELQAIQNSGAHPISLGPLTLRVETAAIYSLSILNYELNSQVEGAAGKF